MGIYFGTDGIRGEYNKNITVDLAEKVGNALSQIKARPHILIGHDTRVSSDALSIALSTGAIKGGASVTNVGIIPTAGVSFLTESENFDFGVMITASHNPPNFNGIKIFSPDGQKLSEKEELYLEDYIISNYTADLCGKYKHSEQLSNKYISHLLSSAESKLNGLKVCIDASNGASFNIAPKVFKKLNAHVIKCSCTNDGSKINVGCGSLHIENLKQSVIKNHADVGFAFDGDADRVVAVSSSGEVFDGDKLLYILALNMQKKNQLNKCTIVGTSQTNSGLVASLLQHNINFIRADVGDKYVIEAMQKENLSLGGEQSGHIIIKPYAKTGDGVLAAIKICETIKQKNMTLDKLFDAKMIPQSNLDVKVVDKMKIINNKNLKNLIQKISNEIAPTGRVLVRASGTEDKIRIMIEHPCTDDAERYALQIKKQIEQI